MINENQQVFLHTVHETVKCLTVGCCTAEILQVKNNQKSSWMITCGVCTIKLPPLVQIVLRDQFLPCQVLMLSDEGQL